MPFEGLELQPKLHQLAISLYNTMIEQSTTGEDGVTIWTGTFTNLTKQMGISPGSYSKLRRRLEAMGCLTFMQKGNIMQPSVIALHQSPADVPWSEGMGRLTSAATVATLRQELDDLRRRLPRMDITATLVALSDDNTELTNKLIKQQQMITRLAQKLEVDISDLDVD